MLDHLKMIFFLTNVMKLYARSSYNKMMMMMIEAFWERAAGMVFFTRKEDDNKITKNSVAAAVSFMCFFLEKKNDFIFLFCYAFCSTNTNELILVNVPCRIHLKSQKINVQEFFFIYGFTTRVFIWTKYFK